MATRSISVQVNRRDVLPARCSCASRIAACGLALREQRQGPRLLRVLRPYAQVRKTQNSVLKFRAFSSKNIEKQRLKTRRDRRSRRDFCGTLMGPPHGARKSKTQNAGVTAALQQGRYGSYWVGDFWTFGPERARPEIQKSLSIFQQFFVTKPRKTKDQTRRNQPSKERLLDRFYGAPRRAGQPKSQKEVSRDAHRNVRRHPTGPAPDNRLRINVATTLSPQTPLATLGEQTTCELCRQKRVSRQKS